MSRKSGWIFPLVLLALVSGIMGGWVRLDWVDLPYTGIPSSHGMLMTGSFMGSLVSLERSINMKSKWWLLVPLVCVLSAPLFWLGIVRTGMSALILASSGLIWLLYFQSVQYRQWGNVIMLLGAISWLIGNILVQRHLFVPMGTGWWTGFILLTILGERLEFGKFLPNPKWSRPLLLVLISVYVIGLLLPFHGIGQITMGWAAVVMGCWLLRFDMARWSFKKQGTHRYNGLGLMVGYVWLVLFGSILVFLPEHPFYYDLLLHSFFLGFAFSMIWAHAPIILPMLFRISGSLYHPILWCCWGLFQLSLAGRMWFRYTRWTEDSRTFAVVNGWVILMMFAILAYLLIKHSHKKREIPLV